MTLAALTPRNSNTAQIRPRSIPGRTRKPTPLRHVLKVVHDLARPLDLRIILNPDFWRALIRRQLTAACRNSRCIVRANARVSVSAHSVAIARLGALVSRIMVEHSVWVQRAVEINLLA